MANVGTVVCFRSGSPADERYVLPLFHPYIEQGEIANLPAYNFYMRIAAVEAKEPLSGITLLVDEEPSEKVAQAVVKQSRLKYGKKVVLNKKSIIKKPKVEVTDTQTNRHSTVDRPTVSDLLAVKEKPSDKKVDNHNQK